MFVCYVHIYICVSLYSCLWYLHVDPPASVWVYLHICMWYAIVSTAQELGDHGQWLSVWVYVYICMWYVIVSTAQELCDHGQWLSVWTWYSAAAGRL